MKNHLDINNCANCRFYTIYYQKAILDFYEVGKGWCSQKQQICENSDFCDAFSMRPEEKKEITIQLINRVLEDIEQLKYLLHNY